MPIIRNRLAEEIRTGLKTRPVTMLLGPRQCGKTTLARSFRAPGSEGYFDLENPNDLARLTAPQMVLEPLKGVIVIDEFQRRPDLLPLLRHLADRRPIPARFLLLGSASGPLLEGVSESLAGRVHIVEMGGFCLEEVGPKKLGDLWLRGGFPEAFTAKNLGASMKWRQDFVATITQQDLPLLGFRFPALTIRRFLSMLAHYHGQIWNGSEIGSSLGVSHHASRRYLDALAQTWLIRELPPWFENLGKRLVKSPKVYFRDSGILHALLSISDRKTLLSHPKAGASWEGFMMEQILQASGDKDAYFFATQSHAELDLLLIRKGRKYGFEFKLSDSPTVTKSMKISQADLALEKLFVVYPGPRSFPLDKGIECLAATDIVAACSKLG